MAECKCASVAVTHRVISGSVLSDETVLNILWQQHIWQGRCSSDYLGFESLAMGSECLCSFIWSVIRVEEEEEEEELCNGYCER